MAKVLRHFHVKGANDARIHWAVRLGAVGLAICAMPEAMPVLIAMGVWVEVSRYMAGQQAFSSGIVLSIDRFEPYIQEERINE